MAHNTQTYIIERKCQIAEIQARICDLLRWDESEYHNFVFECGNEFIEKYYTAAPELIPFVKRSRAFWNWWKVTWWNGDENMLTFIIPSGYTRSEVFKLYCRMHETDPDRAEQLPPRTVWDDIQSQKSKVKS